MPKTVRYVIPHPGILSVQGEGLYDIHHSGTLPVMENLIFMRDVVNKVKKIKCPFKVAWQKQQLPCKMFAVATNKLLESRITAMDIHNLMCYYWYSELLFIGQTIF